MLQFSTTAGDILPGSLNCVTRLSRLDCEASSRFYAVRFILTKRAKDLMAAFEKYDSCTQI